MDAGVLLLRLVLIQVFALTGAQKSEQAQNKHKVIIHFYEQDEDIRLTEQLFFLLALIGKSLIRIGAIFLALAAAFFLSGTRGLLLRFL